MADFEVDKGFILDVAFNFVGFVPLGFLLASVLFSLARWQINRLYYDGFGLFFLKPVHRGCSGVAAVEEFEHVGFGDEYGGGREGALIVRGKT